MANYFNLIAASVHAKDSKDSGSLLFNRQNKGIGGVSTPVNTSSKSHPWYIISPPSIFLKIPSYKPSSFHVYETIDILLQEIKDELHFCPIKEESGCEGLYGFFYYLQLPDIEIGFDFDVGAFISGALSCTLLGLYLNDIYYPRKLMSWWPTRWFFHFLEEGMYMQRSIRWFGNAIIIFGKTTYRAGYGGVTHTFSRKMYYWTKKAIFGGKFAHYSPLFDDTFAALFSAYLWTVSTVETDAHTAHDRIIAIGWTAVFAGLVEFCLHQYFMKNPPPGLFRWLFGGAFYGPGVWRYLTGEGAQPGQF